MRIFPIAVGIVFLLVPALAPAQNELDFLSDLTQFHDLKQMLPDYLNARANHLLDQRREQVATWKGPEDLAKRKAYVRRTIIDSIGGLPRRTPLKARVVGVLERDDYRVEKILFESRPNFFVTANLYLPKTGSAPYPAVLFPLGHERGGKSNSDWQHVLVSLAKKGYVAFTWDPIGQGERYQIYDEDFKRRKVIRSTTEHSILGIQCLLVGANVAQYTIWDGIRALDYMLSRPEVDTARVACTGNSGGGTHTAYLAALEDRIHVAMPSCYLTSWSKLLDTIGPQDAEQVLLPWIGAGLDHADFIYAFAPRPYLMLSGIRDFFSIAGSRATFAEAKDVYHRLDAGGKLDMFEADDRHGYRQPRRLAGYNWLSRWLKGTEDHRPEPEITLASFEELQVTETGQVATSFGGETVFTLNQKQARALDKKLPPLASRADATAFREAIRERITDLSGYHAAQSPAPITPYGTIQRKGYRIEKFTYQSEPGILIPSLLFVPGGEGRHPAIIYVHGEGKAADAKAGGEIETFVLGGYVVLAPDLRGMGETNSVQDINGSDFPRYFGQWNSAMTALLINESLVGMRVKDILQGVGLLAARSEVDSSRIYGFGKQEGGVPLLFAAALDDRIQRLALEETLVSYTAVVNQRLHRRVLENVVRGALRSFDLPDLVSSMTPRPIWLVNAAGPLGQQLPLPAVTRAYAGAAKAYQAAGAGRSLHIARRRSTGGPEATYSEWFR